MATAKDIEALTGELGRIVQGIDQRIDSRIRASNAPRLPSGPAASEESRGGFTDLGEMLATARFTPHDSRLQLRDLSMGEGAGGGFVVPPAFSSQVMMVEPDEAIFRPRATVLSGGVAPDAEIQIPAIDHSGDNGITGGVEVHWTDSEPAAYPTTVTSSLRTEPDFAQVTLKPHTLAAYVVVHNKLLRNAPMVTPIVTDLLRRAVVAAEDDAYLQGNGSGKPLGVIGSDASIEISRTTASDVKYADLAAMLGRARLGSGREYVWIVSQTVIPELLTMEDTAGSIIWKPDVSPSPFPGRLFGCPVLISSSSPTLGTTGDVVLANLRDYVIKLGSGLLIEASPHYMFSSDRTVIRCLFNTDGQPWETGPMELQDGSTTVSSFVVLK